MKVPHGISLRGGGSGWGIAAYSVALLSVTNVVHSMDRTIFSVLLVPIQAEFRLGDTVVGLLSGFAFALFYAVLGLPLARLADLRPRAPLIAGAILIWSGLTAACGLTQNALQLALARFGVGAGEAGFVPAAMSLVSDLVSSQRRALAISIFQAAGNVGLTLGVVLAGLAADGVGWRTAFFLLGAPGILLSLIVRLTLREPPRRDGVAPVAHFTISDLATGLIELVRRRAFAQILLAVSIAGFAGQGMASWLPLYFSRTHHLSLTEIGMFAGVAGGAGGLLGALGGGFASVRLIGRDQRWEAWLPALANGLAMPLYIAMFLADDPRLAFAFMFFAILVLSSGMGAAISAVHSAAPASSRALAIALVLFATSLLGLGFAPLLVGVLSDLLSLWLDQPLRAALMASSALLIVPAWLFVRAAVGLGELKTDESVEN